VEASAVSSARLSLGHSLFGEREHADERGPSEENRKKKDLSTWGGSLIQGKFCPLWRSFPHGKEGVFSGHRSRGGLFLNRNTITGGISDLEGAYLDGDGRGGGSPWQSKCWVLSLKEK